MDTEDVELPTLPSREPSLPPISLGRSSRKRPFTISSQNSVVKDEDLAAAFDTSSDPAVFSDEETPDLENYSGSKRRKKKVYSGTWWARLRNRQSRVGSATERSNRKRKITRNFDSGIFMDDETSSTDLSSDPVFEPLPQLKSTRSNLSYEYVEEVEFDLALKNNVDGLTCSGSPVSLRAKKARKIVHPKTSVDAVDDQVSQLIQRCLEEGSEDVDLSNMSLSSLPPSVLDLKTLVKHGSSINYSSLTSRPRIYLSNNYFSEFPPQILELEDVQLLSLRQNQLQQLPPGIRRLINLKELNISGNQLEHLPFELLTLLDRGVLESFLHEPNPWRSERCTEDLIEDVPLIQKTGPKWQLTRVLTERARETGPHHLPLDQRLRSEPIQKSRPPYLTELCLRKLLHNEEPALGFSHAVTTSVLPLLMQLHQCQTGGGRRCTFCDADMVLPRYQWIEWWRLLSRDASDLTAITTSTTDQLSQGEIPADPPRYCIVERPAIVVHQEWEEEEEKKPEKEEKGDILPFLRMACGCVSQIAGLQEEARRHQAWGEGVFSPNRRS